MQTNQVNTEVKAITSRPALRLVSTKNLEREEWLNIRKQGIGSSDAAAAIGLNPYKSQLELWMDKARRDDEIPKPDPDDDTSTVFCDLRHEQIVALRYGKKYVSKEQGAIVVLQSQDRGS